MKFKRIGKSSDWISDCGMFKIIACNDNFSGAYWPCIREGDGQDEPEIFKCLSKDCMSLEDAEKVISLY